MMSEELLSLKWNNHQTHFIGILSILREHETFIDVTIACGGKLYPAHKFVLSTCSDYFKQMFLKNPSEHPIIFMKDVSSRDMEALMDFMYNGEVNVPQSTLGSLIKTAESLQIKGLAVPDDAPFKKEREHIFKEKRRIESNWSPPAKRLKQKETNYNASNTTKHSPCTPKSKSPTRPVEVSEDIVDDEDSNSMHSEASEHSTEIKKDYNITNENINYIEKLSNDCLKESIAGPSGVQLSKEELEIKQEEVNAEEDENSTWNQECDSRGEEDRGEVSINSDNSNLFVDHLLSGNDGSSLSVSTDSAMFINMNSVELSCRCCEKRFCSRSSLQRHLLSMASIKRHVCDYCNKAFARKDVLKKHMTIHAAQCSVLLLKSPPVDCDAAN